MAGSVSVAVLLFHNFWLALITLLVRYGEDKELTEAYIKDLWNENW